MTIILSDSREKIFATVTTWENADIAAKAIFKKQNWSDIYYSIKFDDGEEVSGSIDLEPASFHQPHQSNIVTWHLRTFWGNISRAVLPRYPLTPEDKIWAAKMLTYLPEQSKKAA